MTARRFDRASTSQAAAPRLPHSPRTAVIGGSACADATGRAIGIDFRIPTLSGGNEGIGLAAPINIAISVMEEMMRADALAQ